MRLDPERRRVSISCERAAGRGVPRHDLGARRAACRCGAGDRH
nr:MAG TPA: hypothetical protein [Caudoviricetes sp.]